MSTQFAFQISGDANVMFQTSSNGAFRFAVQTSGNGNMQFAVQSRTNSCVPRFTRKNPRRNYNYERKPLERLRRRMEAASRPICYQQDVDEEYLENLRQCLPREGNVPQTRSTGPRMNVYTPDRSAPLEEQYQSFCEYREKQKIALQEWREGPQDPADRPFVPVAQTFEDFCKHPF